MATNHPAAPVDGAGAHVKKCRPSKRIKALHRAKLWQHGLDSLRNFARRVAAMGVDSPADANHARTAKLWLAAKGVR